MCAALELRSLLAEVLERYMITLVGGADRAGRIDRSGGRFGDMARGSFQGGGQAARRGEGDWRQGPLRCLGRVGDHAAGQGKRDYDPEQTVRHAEHLNRLAISLASLQRRDIARSVTSLVASGSSRAINLRAQSLHRCIRPGA